MARATATFVLAIIGALLVWLMAVIHYAPGGDGRVELPASYSPPATPLLERPSLAPRYTAPCPQTEAQS